MRTKQDITVRFGWREILIPKGTRYVRATNLPSDSWIHYWAEPWRGMSDMDRSLARNEGIGLSKEDVK